MTYREKIKLLREEKGWNQRQLAVKLDTSPAYITRLESPDGPEPGLRRLVALCLVLETSPNELLGWPNLN